MTPTAASIVALLLLFTTSTSDVAGAPRRTRRDPYIGRQWNLERINAKTAWRTSTGRGATIAIVDTGVHLDHPDLKSNVVVVRGADLVDPDGCAENGCRDDGPHDSTFDHGTSMAGIAAAVANNGEGIAGVAPDAAILPVRVITADNRIVRLADGIRFAADHGADVINLSLGYPAFPHRVEEPLSPYEPFGRNFEELFAAVDYAWDNGAVLVAGAGNGALNGGFGEPPSPFCAEPAGHPRVICVCAADFRNELALYSNFDVLEANYLVAPGGGGGPMSAAGDAAVPVPCEERIPTTNYPGSDRVCPGDWSDELYDNVRRTSPATAHVSGVAALVAALGLDNAETMQVILETAKDLGVPGRDPIYGYGLVNAGAAVIAATGRRG